MKKSKKGKTKVNQQPKSPKNWQKRESKDMRDDFRKREEEKERIDSVAKAKDNDWRWYAGSPQLVKDVASYPFGVPLGSAIYQGSGEQPKYAVPGILSYQFSPAIGNAVSENSPVNVADCGV